MATKIYPLWNPGNPQLRIFLPDFYIKLLKPPLPLPPNIVQFEVHIQMSDIDVKNYLTKIYKLPVRDVITEVERGWKFQNALGGERMTPYKRIAYVHMEKNFKFSYPNLFPELAMKDFRREEAQYNDHIQALRRQGQRHWDRAGAPTWFSV